MDIERHLFNRLSAEDQGMMESPHSTPAKKVRKVVAAIFRDSFVKVVCRSTDQLRCETVLRATLQRSRLVIIHFVHPSQYYLINVLSFWNISQDTNKITPISDVRLRAGSINEINGDKTEVLKQLHMPRKISF